VILALNVIGNFVTLGSWKEGYGDLKEIYPKSILTRKKKLLKGLVILVFRLFIYFG